MAEKENTVYILRCGDGSLYTGWTNDLEARLHAHRSGRGAKYPRSRPPVELVYTERCATRGEALSREAAIKRLTRAEKLALIAAKAGSRRRTAPAKHSPALSGVTSIKGAPSSTLSGVSARKKSSSR